MLTRFVVGLAAGYLVLATFAVQAEETSAERLRGLVVDAEDRPVADATVKMLSGAVTDATKTDAEGRFEFPAPKPAVGGWIYAHCQVQTSDGRMGLLSVQQQKLEEIRIVVKPARRVTVDVRNAADEPVSQASVEFLADLRVVASGETDEQGRFSFLAPADFPNWIITARRSQVGFDYANSGPSAAITPPKPLPEKVALKLDGARTVRFRAVDHEDKPVAGVKIGPWIVQKPDHDSEINLSGTTSGWASTDEQGQASLDWAPEQFGKYLAFIHLVDGYYATEHSISIRADQPIPETLTIQLRPLEKLSGTVTLPDGKPAVKASVQVQGRGTNQREFHQNAVTDENGRYALEVYSEQQYLVTARLGSLVSPIRSDVIVRIGKPVDGVDLVLGPATQVRGRVTLGPARSPVLNLHLSAQVDRGAVSQELPRPADDRYYHGLILSLNATTNADGEYSFLLGPGEYQLSGPPRAEPIKFTIPEKDPPAEIVHDFHMERPEAGPLSGRVVDADGKPVPGAIVQGRYASDHARRWFGETKCDDQGRFQIERSLDPLVIHARSPDGSLAGMIRSAAEEQEVRIPVGPVGAASGILKDKAGNVLAGKKLTYGVRIYMGEPGHSSFSENFGGQVTTDDEGRFTLTGLILGEEYELNIEIDQHSWRRVTQITAKDASPIDLGEVTADPEPIQPYVPPTPAERTAKAFAVRPEASPDERVGLMLADAKVEYFQPLVLFGTPKDPACIELYRLFQERDADDGDEKKPDYAAPNELRWEYDLAALDIDRPVMREYAARLGVDLTPRVPLLVLLDEQGKLSDSIALTLGDDQKLDPKRLGAWMEKHKLPTRNACKSLADALAQAKAENKRVFFTFSATWCGPCRSLSRALAPFKSELEKHFVFVKVDVSRDEEMDALRERYPESNRGGIPWFCILDPQEEKPRVLATSNLPTPDRDTGNSNIGRPTEPNEVEHFLGMLKLGAPELSSETLDACQAALLKK